MKKVPISRHFFRFGFCTLMVNWQQASVISPSVMPHLTVKLQVF